MTATKTDKRAADCCCSRCSYKLLSCNDAISRMACVACWSIDRS